VFAVSISAAPNWSSELIELRGIRLAAVAFMTWPTKKPNSLSLPER